MSARLAPDAGAALDDWLRYKEQVHPRGIDMGLERVAAVAARLGLPDARIPTLTVAGTNGKGSSATLAALIWRAAGHRVGLYTSPHLLDYRERVAVDGLPVSADELIAAFVQIERARGAVPLTYFEFGTLAALWCFRERAVDAQVLEVGLGGRLDAVNLVDARAALVTSIGLDHTDWLGPDRESIAGEKAGVFRSGRPAICADADPPRALAQHAAQIGARYQVLGRDFHFTARAQEWDWSNGAQTLRALPIPGLRGTAQLRNAAGVIAALLALREEVAMDEAHIRAALPLLHLRGRFERVGAWLFDVAHNAEAAQVLAQNLRETYGTQRLSLVLGMLDDKPVEAVCAALAPQVGRVYCAGLPPPRGLQPAQLAARVRNAGLQVQACDNVAAAMRAAREQSDQESVVLVTGSFLTVAAGLAEAGASTHG